MFLRNNSYRSYSPKKMKITNPKSQANPGAVEKKQKPQGLIKEKISELTKQEILSKFASQTPNAIKIERTTLVAKRPL